MTWLERLANRKVKLSQYADQSMYWNQCAVSEAGGVVRLAAGIPVDDRLRELGNEFHKAVKADDRRRAVRCYLAIQTRVLRLARLKP